MVKEYVEPETEFDDEVLLLEDELISIKFIFQKGSRESLFECRRLLK